MFVISVLISFFCFSNFSVNSVNQISISKELTRNGTTIHTVPSIKLFQFGASSYYIGTSLIGDWYQAMQFCRFYDMDLVSIETKEEDEFLRKTIINYIKHAGNEYLFWTSGTILNDKYWVWMSTGRPIDYTNWAPNNPSNSNGNEKCVELIYYASQQQLLMNDKICSSLEYVICETVMPQTASSILKNYESDYYWRDWNSTAPYDAFVATYYNDQSVYVAQAFVGGHGLYIGYIQAGQTNITINTGLGNNAPLSYTDVVKVLCVRGSPFTWISANTDNIHTILEYNLPVVGGKVITDYNTIVYVGRYNITDTSYIGSIHTDLWLYYSDGTIGKDVKEYELLVRAI